MEFSWRTVMLLLGILTVVIIIFDGFRRMKRNREESLRLDIRQDFKFPSTDERSEFPSGGFRVVADDLKDAAPVHATAKASDARVQKKSPVMTNPKKSATSAAVTTGSGRRGGSELDAKEPGSTTTQIDLPDYRDEPIFGGDFTVGGGSFLDPEIGASLTDAAAQNQECQGNKTSGIQSKMAGGKVSNTRVAATKDKEIKSAATKPAVKSANKVSVNSSNTQQTKLKTASKVKTSPSHVNIQSTQSEVAPEPREVSRRRKVRTPEEMKQAAAARSAVREQEEGTQPAHPKAKVESRSVDLEESVPVLMSVDELGKEETAIAMQPLRSEPEIQHEQESMQEDEASSTADVAVTEVGQKDVALDGPTADDQDTVPNLNESSSAPLTDIAEFEASDEDVEEPDFDDTTSPVIFANEDAESLADREPAKVTLVIRVWSRDPKGIYGPILLHLFKECDLRYGPEGAFHRYEEANGKGPIQFSVAQAVKPGYFEPERMEEQHFEGLTFIMTLPGARRPMEAFRAMSELAQVLSRSLDAELRDDSNSVLSEQTLEHYRSQVLEYERQQYLSKRAAANRR